MLMRYIEVMTSGKTLVMKKLVALSVHVLFCAVFLVILLGELTYLRPQHT